MELLDLYDDNGKKIEKTIKRGEKFDEGNIMLSVIFIRNSNNMFLIQKISILQLVDTLFIMRMV